MSTGNLFSNVVQKEAYKLFEEFRPYPDWQYFCEITKIFRWVSLILCCLSILFGTIYRNDEILWQTAIWVSVLSGVAFLILEIIRSAVQVEKAEKFKKEHSDLANILWQ